MLEGGVRHVGVATDKVIESFRNDMWPTYKSSVGMDPAILSQFGPLEDALEEMGLLVWRMVEFEADDALASAAATLAADDRVTQVVICTPDKDLAQCVVGDRVVQLNRRTGAVIDEAGVHAKFGVPPASIPDYLALVGDSADGFPGLPGWGAKTAAAVLARFVTLESIPSDVRLWPAGLRGADRLNATLREQWSYALLFRDLATLRTETGITADLDRLLWRGPRSGFEALCQHLDEPDLATRVALLADKVADGMSAENS
jgi:5'-3' exonuclease